MTTSLSAPEQNPPASVSLAEVEQELESISALLQTDPSPPAVDLESQLQQLQDEELALNRQWLADHERRRQEQRATLRKAIVMAVFALAIIFLLKWSL